MEANELSQCVGMPTHQAFKDRARLVYVHESEQYLGKAQITRHSWCSRGLDTWLYAS